MAFEPSFRRDRNGNLLLTDTLDAKLVKRERRDLQWKECSPGGVVNTEAKASLSAAGGDPTLIQHVLGQYKLPIANQMFNEKSKNEEQQILLQGLDLPKPVMSVKGSIPKALDKPVSLATGKMDPFQFHDPTSTVGKAILKKPVTLKQRVNTETNTVPFILPRLPLPSPLSQSELRFPIPVQLFIPTSTESRVGGPSVPSTVVPYSTQLYRKRKAVQESEGKFKRAYNKRQNVGPPKCKKCGEDKKEPDHRQYRGFRFCRKVDKVSFEEWREIQVKVLADRKKTK